MITSNKNNFLSQPFKFPREASRKSCNEFYLTVGSHKFMTQISPVEELIFCQEFQRPDTTYDADVILIQDIKNLVLFLAPSEIVTKSLIYFLNTETVHSFLKALIIYFEHFMRLMEFILIRKGEISGEKAKIQTEESAQIKHVISSQLSQYRLLLAREYSSILLGNGDMKSFYHIKPIVNISQSIKDQRFHEHFLSFCTVVVWIALHRRDFEVIDMEMNRLFRTEHFVLKRLDRNRLSEDELRMIYGQNYKRCNYRAQLSPLIQELSKVENQNLPLLWIGQRKYRGDDMRVLQIELEFIVPSSQLCLINVSHGILGRPKRLYDTMLNICWEAVHNENYNCNYDPYGIIQQPYLDIPDLYTEEARKRCQTYLSYYQLIRFEEFWDRKVIQKWLRRDEIVNYFKTEGMLTDIWMKCSRDLQDTSYGPSVDEIIQKFLSQKEKLRKK